jgi:hypothetical protein
MTKTEATSELARQIGRLADAIRAAPVRQEYHYHYPSRYEGGGGGGSGGSGGGSGGGQAR